MLFTKLTVENFGVFRGHHTFDLFPKLEIDTPQSIILFGGLNGTGKTTLFESIKLCIYGKMFTKKTLSKIEYNNYLYKKILPKSHKKKGIYHGAIELELIYSSYGQSQKYSIRRFWRVKSNRIEEKLRILRDGKILGSIEEEHGQAFLLNLIPLGLTDLFFFDGEKIQSLADDHDNDLFREAFDSMLGLDIIHKLQNDLRIYHGRNKNESKDDSLRAQSRSLESKRDEYEKSIEDLYQQRAKKESERDHIQSNMESKEIELANQGGGYATQRNLVKKQIVGIEEDLIALRTEIRKICSNLFPFTIVPQLSRKLRNRLVREQIDKMKNSAKLILKDNLSNFAEQVKKQMLRQYNLRKEQEEQFLIQITKIFNDTFLDKEKTSVQLTHDFSETELTKILSWIDQSLTVVPSQIIEKTKTLEKATVKRRNLEDMLQKVPAEEAISPIVKDINRLHQRYGELSIELKRIDEKISSTQYKLVETQRSLKQHYEKLHDVELSHRRLILLKKVMRIFSDFADVLRHKKVEIISDNFTLWLERLLNKDDLVSRVFVSLDDYSIRLQQMNGNYIDKTELSNGEKQIYAIAMLMALARSSGFSLPFIIDTPLARLDSSHRKNIVSQFFPYASHQVIMFSTDTEVDKTYFNELSPHIARIYHLVYKPDRSSTVVEKGYFWKKEVINN